jgi:class 3 adenylate cyclase
VRGIWAPAIVTSETSLHATRHAVKRKISAILAADIAGYSKLVADDEEEALRRLETYRPVFDDLVARWDGRIFNRAGDAVLAEFPSSVDAVRCGVDLQDSIGTQNLDFPQSRRMLYRIGVTVADVVERDGDLLGDGVNIAARLSDVAKPGGICVSRAVYEQVANKLPVKFDDLGRLQLKNIPEAMHVYRVASPHAGPGAPQPKKHRRMLVAATIAALAVVAAAAIAVQLRDDGQGSTLAAAPANSAAGPTGRSTAALFDDAKVRALAASKDIPLPQTLKVVAPAAAVPQHMAAYLGAWASEQGWNGNGRQVMLVIESVDDTGTALGVMGVGPPEANAPDRRPARFRAVAGSITDAGYVFSLGGQLYTFRSTSDGLMVGIWQPQGENGKGNLTTTLNRIN